MPLQPGPAIPSCRIDWIPGKVEAPLSTELWLLRVHIHSPHPRHDHGTAPPSLPSSLIPSLTPEGWDGGCCAPRTSQSILTARVQPRWAMDGQCQSHSWSLHESLPPFPLPAAGGEQSMALWKESGSRVRQPQGAFCPMAEHWGGTRTTGPLCCGSGQEPPSPCSLPISTTGATKGFSSPGGQAPPG